MPRRVLLDEVVIRVTVPAAPPDAEAGAARRALRAQAFMAAVREAVRVAMNARPGLTKARATLSR